MNENVYRTDVEVKKKYSFSKGFRWLLGFGIFLTGFASLGGLMYIIFGIREQLWRETSLCMYVRNVITYLCIMCCFVFMVKIATSGQLFSKLSVMCIRIIGVLITASAFLLPQLAGYQDSGFVIMHSGNFTLADGYTLLFGIILLIFAAITKEGFSMQNEIDEIL